MIKLIYQEGRSFINKLIAQSFKKIKQFFKIIENYEKTYFPLAKLDHNGRHGD